MMWQQLDYAFLWENVPQPLSAKCPSHFGQFSTTPPFPNFYKLEPSNLTSEFAWWWGGEFHSGINCTEERRVLVQTQLADGIQANGGTGRLAFRGCFENRLSCEYQTLYCLDSGDLIYQNEVIHPAREDKPSFQRINQVHQGPRLPPYLQPGSEYAFINLAGPREPPTPVLHIPLNQKGTQRPTKRPLATG